MAKRVIKLFAVEDAKIRKVLTDPEAGPMTLGPAIDVPGIKQGVITGDVNTVGLRGDNRKLDQDTTVTDVMCTFDHAKLSFDVLEVMMGGTTVGTGVTPNTVDTYSYASTNVFGEFVLEFRTPRYSDGSDVHMRTAKLKLTTFPEVGLVEEDYKTVEGLECSIIPSAADVAGRYFSIISNETAAAIAATFVSA